MESKEAPLQTENHRVCGTFLTKFISFFKFNPTETPDSSGDLDQDGSISKAAAEKKGNKEKRGTVMGDSTTDFSNFKPKVVVKPENVLADIKATLKKSLFFSHLDSTEINTIALAMERFISKEGNIVITQGKPGDYMYIVKEGTYEAYKKHAIFVLTDVTLRKFGPGEVFGELALLYNAPRSASVRALTAGVLYGLDRDTFVAIVKDSAIKRRQTYLKFLKGIPIMKVLNPYELETVADSLKTQEFKKGQLVIVEGDIGSEFFLLVEGKARVLKRIKDKEEVHVKDYEPGAYFGELALMNNTPRAASIMAMTSVKVASLDRASFERLLGPLREKLIHNASFYSVEFEKAIEKNGK